MPSVKRRASKILNEYGAAQSELIGKAVVLTDGKAGTVENVWLECAGRCRAVPDHPATLKNLRPLQATSTSLAIPTAISFALFAQLVLVEASLSQFATHIPPNWSLAGLPVCAAISFAPLP